MRALERRASRSTDRLSQPLRWQLKNPRLAVVAKHEQIVGDHVGGDPPRPAISQCMQSGCNRSSLSSVASHVPRFGNREFTGSCRP